MANKVLNGISLFFCVIALGITSYAIVAENWVNFDNGSDTLEYGLWSLTDGPDGDIGKSWN